MKWILIVVIKSNQRFVTVTFAEPAHSQSDRQRFTQGWYQLHSLCGHWRDWSQGEAVRAEIAPPTTSQSSSPLHVLYFFTCASRTLQTCSYRKHLARFRTGGGVSRGPVSPAATWATLAAAGQWMWAGCLLNHGVWFLCLHLLDTEMGHVSAEGLFSCLKSTLWARGRVTRSNVTYYFFAVEWLLAPAQITARQLIPLAHCTS